MVAIICPSCSVAMSERRAGASQFEECPKCGGAWFERDQFEQLASATTSSVGAETRHDQEPGWAAFPLSRPRTLIKVALGGAVAFCLIAGLVGYYVVRPLWSQASSTAKAIVAQDLPANVEQLKRQAGTFLGPQAKEAVGQAATSVEDASKRLRERLGVPANATSASEKAPAESPNTTEAD